MRSTRSVIACAATAFAIAGCATDATPLAQGRYGPDRTWMETQFDQVVTQAEDFSCGAAALATLLNHYYGLDVTEADVLAVADDASGMQIEDTSGETLSEEQARERGGEDVRVTGFSFAELTRFAEAFGFRGKGYRADFAALQTLKLPVIAHIGTEWYQHFVVVREVTPDYVVYADPTWGNRRVPSGRFQQLWSYSEGELGQGRVLAILPGEQREGIEPAPDFFEG